MPEVGRPTACRLDGGRSRARGRRHRSPGLTLIEILISVAILASGTVVIMQAVAQGAHGLSVAKHRMRAYSFSRAKMADLEISLKQGLEPKTRGQFRMGHEQFRWKVQASPLDDPELQLVTLTVTWRQGQHDYESQFSTVNRVELEEAL